MKPPSQFSALPPVISQQASPKAISRRTSYLLIRLEFLRYPQVITDYFNRRVFGPPQCFTTASTCSWIGHQVSGLRHATLRTFRTRSRFGSATVSLNLAAHRNSPARSTKSTTSHSCGALSARKHTVSGSLSLPSRGSFHRSLTVLYSIGHMVVFSLTRWSSLFPSGFLVSRRTPDPCLPILYFAYGDFTLFVPLFQYGSAIQHKSFASPLPRTYYYLRFGLLRFRSPLLSESFLLSFPPGIEMFQFPGFPSLRYGFT